MQPPMIRARFVRVDGVPWRQVCSAVHVVRLDWGGKRRCEGCNSAVHNRP